MAGVNGVGRSIGGKSRSEKARERIELGKQDPVGINRANILGHTREKRSHVVFDKVDLAVADALEKVVAKNVKSTVFIELPRSRLLERIAPIVGPNRDAVGIDRAIPLVHDRLSGRIEVEHRYRARDSMRHQQAVERRPRQPGHRAVWVGVARPEMTIAERLSDPSGSGFVERVEAHDVGQVADAARDLAHRAEVVIEHVVLDVDAVDCQSRCEVAAGEEQGPHDAVGGTARIRRPAHGRVAILLAAAARIVI